MMWYMRFPGGKAKALTLSYDDGVRQDGKLIEIFNKNGIKGTFNIHSEGFGKQATGSSGEDRSHFTKEEAIDIYRDHEVALHSYSHPFMDKIPHDRMAYEIVKDREILEETFGRIVKGMAYPMGTTSDEVVDVLKACGVSYARTTVQTGKFDLPTDWLRMPSTCHHDNPKLMEYAKDFLESPVTRMPRLFYVWGHAYEFDRRENWDRIEAFCEYVGGKDDVWYATNMEIYEYVEAYSRLKTSADGSLVYNPTNTTLYFCNQKLEASYVVAPGETIRT